MLRRIQLEERSLRDRRFSDRYPDYDRQTGQLRSVPAVRRSAARGLYIAPNGSRARPWQRMTEASRPVSRLSAAMPRAALRRTTAPRLASWLSRTDMVPGMAAKGCVKSCGWHGMQEVSRPHVALDWPPRHSLVPYSQASSWTSYQQLLVGPPGHRFHKAR